MTGIWQVFDTDLVVHCICWEREKVEACKLQNSRSYRHQRALVDLSPALSREKWFNNCGGMLLLFGMLSWRSKGGEHCCDTKTTVTKEPWVCKARLGSRWGQFSHKRKCYLLPDVSSLCTGTVLTVGEGLANCVVEIKKVQSPTQSGGEFELGRNDSGWSLLDFLPLLP